VVALFIWLATGANTAGPPQSGASSAQTSSSTPGETTATPINLNTADVATLEQLPGIGEVRAQAIINYRQANGPFNTIEDILNVKGIGPETFAQIRESITV
jgi:competence protein ComEA